MTRSKGMDELSWGQNFENIRDQVERLKMAMKVKGIDEQMLFKIGRLNLRNNLRNGLTSWQLR